MRGEGSGNSSLLLPLESNTLCMMLYKRNKTWLAQATLKYHLILFFFHLLLFQIVESFTDVESVEPWELGLSLYWQRRKQVANINIRAISCVVWVEQWLGRTALWLRGLTNTQQSVCGFPAGAACLCSPLTQWWVGCRSSPWDTAPAQLQQRSSATSWQNNSQKPYLAVWDISAYYR